MRKTVLLLSASTLLFAGVAVHFWLQLRDRGPETQLLAACPSETRELIGVQPPDGGPAALPAPPAVAKVPACDPHRARLEREQALAQSEYLTQLRAALSDPAKRATMLEQRRRMMRANEPRLAAFMGLHGDESEALITLLAEQELTAAEENARCSPHCTMSDGQARNARNQLALRDLLGPERAELYARYQHSRMERMAVDRFRANLPDAAAMSDEQYENLIEVLADERQKFEREMTASGLDTAGFGGGVGMFYWDQNQHSVEERVAAARKYAARLHARAASVLSEPQLRLYDDAQEAGLANMADTLPWLDATNRSNAPTLSD